MLPISLLKEKLIQSDGVGPSIDLIRSTGKLLVLTLGITRNRLGSETVGFVSPQVLLRAVLHSPQPLDTSRDSARAPSVEGKPVEQIPRKLSDVYVLRRCRRVRRPPAY
jgi:hypothetical protein